MSVFYAVLVGYVARESKSCESPAASGNWG
jgi:hypothetical protein